MQAMMAARDYKHSHYISLVGPKDEFFKLPRDHLRLFFDDVEDASAKDWKAPTREDVDQIIEFAKTLPSDADLLIHCWAGISRSTAAAIGICCFKEMAPGEALKHVREIREATLKKGYMVLPNRLIIKHFDDALDLKGELCRVVDEYYAGLPLIGVTTLPNRGGWNTTE